MKTQKFIVEIEMPNSDFIGAGWLQDLIQCDCDVEDTDRQKVTVKEIFKDINIIKIPSEREIEKKSEQYTLNIPNIDGFERTLIDKAYTDACEWLKSKIVK